MFHAFTKPCTITSLFIDSKLYCIDLIYVRNHKGVIRKSEVKVKQGKRRGDFRLGTIRDFEGFGKELYRNW